ncbi:hypothetical protein BU17DRAFT_64775 [Hysterangium stoloniferum]|nr:hypothetical protein BU17DRAFT_64775 [Hysterangium stoloniferum]
MSKTAINMKISPQALKQRKDLRENEELFAKFPLALMVTIVDPIVRMLLLRVWGTVRRIRARGMVSKLPDFRALENGGVFYKSCGVFYKNWGIFYKSYEVFYENIGVFYEKGDYRLVKMNCTNPDAPSGCIMTLKHTKENIGRILVALSE